MKLLAALLFLLIRLVWWGFRWLAFIDPEDRAEKWVAGVWLGLSCGAALTFWWLGLEVSDLERWAFG